MKEEVGSFCVGLTLKGDLTACVRSWSTVCSASAVIILHYANFVKYLPQQTLRKSYSVIIHCLTLSTCKTIASSAKQVEISA